MRPTPVPHELLVGWQHALTNWTLRTTHDTLLGLAAKHGEFAWLASRYRASVRTNPFDPIAQERLSRVQRAATASALAKPPRAERGAPRYRAGAAMLMAMVVATAVCLWITDKRVHAHARPVVQAPQPTSATP